MNPAAAACWPAWRSRSSIFYILKIRLRRVPVSTLLFWRQIFEEKKPRSLWQRLRHLLSLLVQLLPRPARPRAGRAVLPLAEARGPAAGAGRRQLGQHERRPTWPRAGSQAAKAEGLRSSTACGSRDEMAIIAGGHAAAGRLRPDRPPADAPRRPSTRSRRPTGRPGSPRPSPWPAGCSPSRSRVAQGRSSSPTAASTARPSWRRQEDVELVAVGKKTGNVGITRLPGPPQPARPDRLRDPGRGRQRLGRARSSAGSSSTWTTTPIDVVPLKLEPGEHWSQVFEKTSADGGRLTRPPRPRPTPWRPTTRPSAILPRREPPAGDAGRPRATCSSRRSSRPSRWSSSTVVKEPPRGDAAGRRRSRSATAMVPEPLPAGPGAGHRARPGLRPLEGRREAPEPDRDQAGQGLAPDGPRPARQRADARGPQADVHGAPRRRCWPSR